MTASQIVRLDARRLRHGIATRNIGGMQTTDWDRLDGRPAKPTREAFARQEADRLGVTVDHFLRFHHVEPCDCGAPGCEGWAVRYRTANRRRNGA